MDRESLDALRMNRAAAEAGARERARPWIVGAFVGVVVLGALIAWWSLREVPVMVQTAVARESVDRAANAGSAILNASGYVVARRVATIASKVTGQVLEVRVEEGTVVEEGAVLAVLDPTSARAELALYAGQLETARRNAAEVRVRLEEARRTQERTRELHAQRLVSQADLDAAAANADALAARLEVVSSEVSTSEDLLALAQIRLDDTVIRAPFAGVVVSKNAQPGETISPMSSGGFTRTGIATIVDMQSLEVEVDVNEAFINRVQSGQPVEAVLDAYPEWRIPASVISIVPTADRQKATVKVRIGFETLDPRILPEMGVQVWFMERDAGSESTPRTAAWIPQAALRSGQDGDFVFVVIDGRADRRTVRAGQRRNGEVEITAGIAGGDTVITDAGEGLADGVLVEQGALQ